MTDPKPSQKKAFDRGVFSTGEYLRHFTPDDRRNPFHGIYARKKRDALRLISSSGNSQFILDVGGGTGRLSLALAQATSHDVVLTDISLDMLRQAVRNAGRSNALRPVNADAHQLPFRDGLFDGVVGLDLFCHLDRPERALREFHRVLKKGGVLILDSTNSNPLWAFFYPRYLGKNPVRWLKIIKLRGVYPGWETIVRHYSRKRFLSWLRETGFRPVKNINYGPLICPKWHLAVAEKIL